MIRCDVVLVGAGAAHLVALRHLAMRPLPAWARLSLVVPEAEQPYSGAVPAVMAGALPRAAAMLDLARLARAAGARLILAEASGLDRAAGEVRLRGRPPLRWDWLSLCPGADTATVPGVAEHALPMKPLGRLLDRWEAALRPGLRVVVAGGGAAGVETAFAARARLGSGAPVTLVSPAPPGAALGPGPARAAARALAEAGVELVAGRAERVGPGEFALAEGGALPFDLCLWAGSAAPPAWLADSGLARDAEGWFLAEPTLLARGEARIFLAGDIATVAGEPRPRNGVFSVRQGVPLAENLRAALEGRPLRPFRPQRRHLALLRAGGAAIAAWGGFALHGRWALRWKDRIDRRWVESFRRLPPQPMAAMPAAAEMRCDGCGAKLPPAVLRGALARLGGLPGGAADDAAMLPPLPGLAVQSVDLFRPPASDPWVAGRIAAAHALGDLAAMGAEPRAALALVALPPAPAAVQEGDLFQMLHGACSVLEPAGAALLGGHSAEGVEAMIGFSVTGAVPSGAALPRGGLVPGQALILTRPLGIGAVLAAAAQGRARGADLAAALDAMQADPMPAARLLRAHGATAAADVTGFGLLGHLGEMLDASGCGAWLDLGALPVLPGALEALAGGVRSTLHPGNAEELVRLDGVPGPTRIEAVADPRRLKAGSPPNGAAGPARLEAASNRTRLDGVPDPARLALLTDPQTSGGLLAGVPAERAAACLAALREAGIAAANVGHTVPGPARVSVQPAAAPLRSASDASRDGNPLAGPGKPLPAAAR